MNTERGGLTAVSLFAGVGGIDLAMHNAGIKVVAAVEKDKAARGVLADRLPDTTLFTDVTEVTGDDLLGAGFVPERGVLAAGWPCQGNSVAGARGGMADPRSGLWRHVVRLLAETRPRWFFGENVPGLLSVNDGEDFETVIGDVAGIGYGLAWRVLDAQYFGVPQRRRRVFFVGGLGDRQGPVQVLLEPEGRTGDLAARQPTWAGSAPDAARGADGSVPTLTARHGKGTDSDATDTLIVSTLQGGGRRGHRIDAEAAGGGHLIVCPTGGERVDR